MSLPFRFLLVALTLSASTARAGELRDLCPDRPGLGTPACTLDPGHVMVEIGLADWTHDENAAQRTDTLIAGDMLLRLGLDDRTEAQIGWTAFGRVEMRDRVSGVHDTVSRTGDVLLAVRRNLMNPDGSGTAVAIMPYVTLPVGRSPVGAGDWGAGVLMPMSFTLTDSLSAALTPEIDAAVDGDGDGRHLAYGAVAGLGVALSEALSASLELSAFRDEDPQGHATSFVGGLSLGWQPSGSTQLDVGANLGLDRDSPDVELAIGVSRRF